MSKRPVPSHRTRRVAASPAAAGFRPAVGVLAVAAAFSLHAPAVFAQPAGAQAIHGTATLNRNGNNLVVTTTNGAGTNHSAINWQSFSVPGGSVTQFNQPSASSLSVNRVVGNDPSAIYGRLSSNGRLVLVNPAGITVGAGAVVDTAGFTASTLRMREADAIAGRLVFGDGSAGAGVLQVDGRIVAKNGDVVLIAPKVETGAGAVIQAEDGSTILAAGQKAELTGRGLEGIRLEVQAGNSALNLGTLKGDAVGIFADTLKHSGLVQANSVATEGGKVVLKAAGGDALVEGTVTASSATGKGGSVDILGNRVALRAGAAVDASGAAGGGSVRIGGDFQGKNAEVPNAQRTYVDPQATVKADATVQGDGGRIIVWADDTTQGNGTVSARGGPQGGDGGFVEISGKKNLQFAASVDTSAPKGKLGTLLLDPDYLSIDSTGTAYTAAIEFDDVPTSMSVSSGSLTAANANINLQANYDIAVNSAVTLNPSRSFTAEAGGSIYVNAPITTTAADVSLYAGSFTPGTAGPGDGRVVVSAPINTNGGNIHLQSDKYVWDNEYQSYSSIRVNGNLNAGSGAVSMTALEDVDIQGPLTITGNSVNVHSTGGWGFIYVGDANINGGTGGVTLQSTGGPYGAVLLNSGTNITTSGGGGITLAAPQIEIAPGATLNSGSGALAVNSVSIASVAGSLTGGSVNVSASDGDVVIGLVSMAPAGGSLSGGSVNVSAMNGQVLIGGGATLSATGGVTISGDTRNASYPWAPGVELGDVSITGDTITINGKSGYSWGVLMNGSVSLTASSTAVTGLVESVGSGGGGIMIDGGFGGNLTGSGHLFLTGTTPVDPSQHKGVFLDAGGSINRTSGNVVLNGSGTDLYGVAVRNSNIQTTGIVNLMGDSATADGVYLESATVGSSGGNVFLTGTSVSGVGVYVQTSTINATGAAVTIDGTSQTGPGFSMFGTNPFATINAGTQIDITGTTNPGSGASAIHVGDENFNAPKIALTGVNGDINLANTTLNTGAATDGEIKLRASAAAPAVAGINLAGTTALNAGNSSSLNAIVLEADKVDLGGGALTTAPAGRVNFVPVDTARAISLGGTDETGKLTLSQAELNKINAGTIVVGSSATNGGLMIEGGSPLTITAPALSLIQSSSSGITQMAGSGLVVNALNADAGSVALSDASNNVSQLAGKATSPSGSFYFTNATGFNVGTVDMQSGILAAGAPAVLIAAAGGSIGQTEKITAGGLTAITSGAPIILDHASNEISAFVNAQTGPGVGSINIVNSYSGPSAFNASSSGTIAYKAAGAVTLESVSTSATDGGTTFGTAAISIEAASITPTPPPPSASPSLMAGGSVYLKANGGDIGSAGAPVGIMAPGGIMVAGGANVHLSTGTPLTVVHDLITTGNVTLAGPAGGMLDLRAAHVGGSLGWTNYASASLGSAGGLVGAVGAITAAGNVYVKGMLAPGGEGGISTMSVSGNLDVQTGATLKFDFDSGGGHDVINVTGNTTFASPDGSTTIYAAGSQPPNGPYTLINGTTSGGLPAVSGTLDGVTLAFGSLIAQVSAAPTSAPTAAPPPPTSAPTAAPTVAPTSPPASAPPPAPTEGPTAAPTAPPTPAPTAAPPGPPPPPSTSAPAQQQVESQVVTFAKLFVEAAKTQDEEDKGDVGRDDIVITDTQCQPGS
jgi:filamentous hemagglutinin family protein